MSASESEEVDEESDEEDTPEDEEQPEIEDDEMAEWGEVGESVAEAEDADEESDEEQQAPPELDDLDVEGVSLGDIYCNALGMGAAVARDRYGDPDGDTADMMDEYADLAHQLEIGDYVDQWLAEQGGVDNLGPGQAVVVMSCMFPVLVALDDPTLAENVMEAAQP